MKNLIKIVFTSIILLTSCTKDSLEVCGTITGGEERFNPAYGFPEYYFKINGNYEKVDQKTYESFFVGEYICLQ